MTPDQMTGDDLRLALVAITAERDALRLNAQRAEKRRQEEEIKRRIRVIAAQCAATLSQSPVLMKAYQSAFDDRDALRESLRASLLRESQEKAWRVALEARVEKAEAELDWINQRRAQLKIDTESIIARWTSLSRLENPEDQ